MSAHPQQLAIVTGEIAPELSDGGNTVGCTITEKSALRGADYLHVRTANVVSDSHLNELNTAPTVNP